LQYFCKPRIGKTSETSIDVRLGPHIHPGRSALGQFLGSSNEEGRMWGFLIGLYIAMIIYPLVDEWQQRAIDKKRLANMRRHHALGHRWDVAKGRWSDE
jgi:hypothetical protein